MTGRKVIISSAISSVAGILFGCLISYLNNEWSIANILFYPVWFIGIYFCGTPWKWIFRLWMVLEIFKVSKRFTIGDRYHIVENLIGGIVLALIITIGWVIGLVRFVYYIIKVCTVQGNN